MFLPLWKQLNQNYEKRFEPKWGLPQGGRHIRGDRYRNDHQYRMWMDSVREYYFMTKDEHKEHLIRMARQVEIEMENYDAAIANGAIISLNGLTADEVLDSLISNGSHDR